MAAPLISPLRAWLASLVDDQIAALRSDRYPADLGAAAYPLVSEDRTCEVRYMSGDLRPFAGGCRRSVVGFDVRISYRTATETTAVDAADGDAFDSTARDRCADDAAFLREALLDASHYATIAAGWTIVMLTPGVHTIEPGDGAIVGVLPVAMVASYSPTDVTAGAALA